MDITENADLFANLVQLLCAAAADAGAPDLIRELEGALDDLAAYCSKECSRALMVSNGAPEEPNEDWMRRTSPGFAEVSARLQEAMKAFGLPLQEEVS